MLDRSAQRPVRRPVRHVALVGSLLAAAIGVALATSADPVGAAPGGRLTLELPGRLVDTRLGPKVTEMGLPELGKVWIVDADVDGTATIHPCASAPGPVPTVLFEAEEFVYTNVANSEPMCLTLSTPAHVIVDRTGAVAASPFGGGLQYVPDDAQPVVFDAEVDNPPNSSTTTTLDLGIVPTDARGAVLLLEARNP